MFKGSSRTYRILFERQVENFIEEYSKVSLAKRPYPIAVGVSAGADSIALLRFCSSLKIKYPNLQFTILHFNHQTRPKENEQEEKFVENLCQKFQLPLLIGRMEKPENSELAWRQARQEFFKKSISSISPNATLWLAHHLDDSWEWSQMQQAKSGHYIGQLGIAVCHGAIFRPFLSVTKKQIKNYLKYIEQNFLEDSSNLNLQYERNWWRHKILKRIQKKYPQTLKHYVQRSKEAALKLGVIYGQTSEATCKILDSQTHQFILTKDQKIQHSEHLIKKSLHQLSNFDRMKLRKQLKSLFQSYQNRKKGPIYFSGGVKAFLGKYSFVLTTKDSVNSDILNVP